MELKNYPAPYVLFGSLLAMGNRLQAAGDRFYDEITTKQWFVLAVLENFSAPPTLGELARGVGSSHQNVKQLVLKLQQKGYVALAQDGRDARKNRVHRTPKCAELPEKYGARQQEFMRALYTGIRADEAEQAAGVLARMLQNLEKMQTVEEGLECKRWWYTVPIMAVHAGMLNGWHRRWMPMLRRKGRRTRALCRTMNA